MIYNYDFYYNLYKNDIWSHYYQWTSFNPQWDIIDYLEWQPYSENVRVIISNSVLNNSQLIVANGIEFIEPKVIIQNTDFVTTDTNDGWFAISNNNIFYKEEVGVKYYNYYYCGRIDYNIVKDLDQTIKYIDIKNIVDNNKQIIERVIITTIENTTIINKNFYLYNLPFHTGIIINKQQNLQLFLSEGADPYTNINIQNQDVIYSICQNLSQEKTISNYLVAALPNISGFYFKLNWNYQNNGKPYYKITYVDDLFHKFNQNYIWDYNYYLNKYYTYQRTFEGQYHWFSNNIKNILCLQAPNNSLISYSYLADPDEIFMYDFYKKNNNNYENCYIDTTYSIETVNNKLDQDQILKINSLTGSILSSKLSQYYIRIY